MMINTIGYLLNMVLSAFWHIMNPPLFNNFRLSLLYRLGEAGSREIHVTLIYRTKGIHKTVRGSLLNNEGKTDLTPLGGVIQVERDLIKVGYPGINLGITF
jgi:hypothetical protein